MHPHPYTDAELKMLQAETGEISLQLFPPDAHALKKFGDLTKAMTLLAQGIRLGESNLPPLTEGEVECLRSIFYGSLTDILFVRHLLLNIEDSVHPDAGTLREKLQSLGDFEMLALMFRYINPQTVLVPVYGL